MLHSEFYQNVGNRCIEENICFVFRLHLWQPLTVDIFNISMMICQESNVVDTTKWDKRL